MLAHKLDSPKAKTGVCADSDTLYSEIEHIVPPRKVEGFWLRHTPGSCKLRRLPQDWYVVVW
jgi:hypothetical protein